MKSSEIDVEDDDAAALESTEDHALIRGDGDASDRTVGLRQRQERSHREHFDYVNCTLIGADDKMLAVAAERGAERALAAIQPEDWTQTFS